MAQAQTKVYLTVNENSVTATLTDNKATRTLIKWLSSGPITVSMSDYGGFEKVGTLPDAVPSSDSRITTVPGDIMLYQGRSIVVFYGSNTWSYTPLGKVDNTTPNALKSFLGTGNITMKISLYPSSGIDDIIQNDSKHEKIYDLRGNLITDRPLSPGLYIIDGRKKLIMR